MDWDADSSQLRRNLESVLRRIRDAARRREIPSIEAARDWQARTMKGLRVPDPTFVGRFRGEDSLHDMEVRIGRHRGVAAPDVPAALAAFQDRLQEAVHLLDEVLPPGAAPDADSILAVIDLCAWAHAEWIRIHPFANGNGRTARLWANSLAMRYGLPPFVRLRPRPDGGYGAAGEQAMRGDWDSSATVFRQMLREFLERPQG